MFDCLKQVAPKIMNFVLKTHPSRGVQIICWKYGISLKIKSVTDALIITCRKFPNNTSWEQQRILSIVGQMVALWLKLQMKIVN